MTIEQERVMDKVERERLFHNKRYTQETRSQGKFYQIINQGRTIFWDHVKYLSINSNVLEYGCGSGSNGLTLSPIAKSYTGIDISDVGVKRATLKTKNHLLNNTNYIVMNAEEMTFSENTFDLIFGIGIVHHLDIDKSMTSVSKTLKKGGTAIFWEPLGVNPFINLYRHFTPNARTPDEHPLLPKDVKVMEKNFTKVEQQFFGFCVLLALPLEKTKLFTPTLNILLALDRIILKIPGLRWLAWYSSITLKN